MDDKNIKNIAVDFSNVVGSIRPLHGANNGPICLGGLIDLTPWHKEIGFPFIRLHDCNWPADDVVDVHVVFPDFDADPDNPQSYDFKLTDHYIKAILDTGAKIVYRLGCRIEHTPYRRHAHPPKDFEKWARICTGIVRHYNEGWADGHRWDICHWEIWNEPDWPPGCWSGTWEDYYRLYNVTAKTLKAHDSHLQVGGPAFSYGNEKQLEFVEGFLQSCQREKVPLDFFSWHTYTGSDLTIWERRARIMRGLLDRYDFKNVPSHLNEWNCHPDGSWKDFSAFSRGLSGPRGASGDVASLIYFQDMPLDMTFIYTADTLIYGLFNYAGERQKNWYALRAFRHILDTPTRCFSEGNDAEKGIAVLAGKAEDGHKTQVLMSNYIVSNAEDFRFAVRGFPWSGPTEVSVCLLDETHNLDVVRTKALPAGEILLEEKIPMATVVLYQFKPAEEK